MMKLEGRPFISRSISLDDPDSVQLQILGAIPEPDVIKNAFFRLIVTYPRDWEAMIDETAIRRAAEAAFEFHFIRRPLTPARLRIPGDKTIANLLPSELLDLYWKTIAPETNDIEAVNELAGEIIQMVETGAELAENEAGDRL
jgi:exonuclease SbcD